MQKVIFVCATVLAVILILICIYEYPWLTYNFQKMQLTPVELIRLYTMKSFSDNVEVESIEFIKDGWFDESIKAVILVPSEEINELFPERIRDYNKLHSVFETGSESISFSSAVLVSVTKLISRTQRNIHFTVMKSERQYTKIYLSVNHLGWSSR